MEVRNPNLYKVVMREYERGYGQRLMGTKYFDNEEEALKFCEEWSDYSDPECYFRAEYVGRV